jgi:hypothetical protein
MRWATNSCGVLAQSLMASATIDWTKKGSVRAKMRIGVRKMLARLGSPRDLQKAAVDLVVQQAERWPGIGCESIRQEFSFTGAKICSIFVLARGRRVRISA